MNNSVNFTYPINKKVQLIYLKPIALQPIALPYNMQNIENIDHLLISLCYWSQSVQKHPEVASFCKCLYIPHVPLIDADLFPFLFFKRSRLEVFCIKRIFTNFAKFARKRLCMSLHLAKLYQTQPAMSLKKVATHMFPFEFIIKIFTQHLRANTSVFCMFFSNVLIKKLSE